MEKNDARQLTLKIFMQWPKKNSYKEFDNEKKIPASRKFPSPPPHNFSNGPSLRGAIQSPGYCGGFRSILC